MCIRTNAQFHQAVSDAGTKQIVRNEVARYEAVFNRKRSESTEIDGDLQRVIREHSEVDAGKLKALNGSAEDGGNERYHMVSKKCRSVTYVAQLKCESVIQFFREFIR